MQHHLRSELGACARKLLSNLLNSATNQADFFNHYKTSRLYTIRNTEAIHAHFFKHGLARSDVFIANSLLDSYSKCSSMEDALKLFDEIPARNVVSLNIIISGCKDAAFYEHSWRIFCEMHSLDFVPTEFTYGSVLSTCVHLQRSVFGEMIYALSLKNGFFSNGYVRTGAIDLFSKCGRFDDALKLFDDFSCQNVASWNSTISGALDNAEAPLALNLFFEMRKKCMIPNSFTFSSIIRACAMEEVLEVGEEVHGLTIKCGSSEDVFVGTALVDFYGKLGETDESVKLFSHMPARNIVSWTALLSVFVQNGDIFSALKLFEEMRKLQIEMNIHTITSILTCCRNLDSRKVGVQLHGWTLKTGFCLHSAVRDSLICMYGKIGEVNLCVKIFSEAETDQSFSTCSVMVSSFAQNKKSESAVDSFLQMIRLGMTPDILCTSSVVSVVESVNLGKQIHCYSVKTGMTSDITVSSSFLRMYSKCDCLEESFDVFEEIRNKDRVSWCSMIAGLAEHGYAGDAIELFREMKEEEDEKTLIAVLTACAALRSLRKGKEVHCRAIREGLADDLHLRGAIINTYCKCGVLDSARSIFDLMQEKDAVSCSSLVTGYIQKSQIHDAMLIFRDMMNDFSIDSFTLSSMLGGSGNLNRSAIVTQLHSFAVKLGFVVEVSVGSSLVQAYSKCGRVEECRRAFEKIGYPDLISWTAMIASYAEHGEGDDALKTYDLMRKEGIEPDGVTFVGLLSACSHGGLVEEGYFYLKSMVKDYGIEPGSRHYACMVDVLGRSGRLEEAERFIEQMPMEADAFIWGTLLSACRVHGNVALGKRAAEKSVRLMPSDSGAYVSLSNICAEVGQWREVVEVRSLMNRRVPKAHGWSSITRHH